MCRSLFVLGDSISIQYGPVLEKALKGTFAYSRKSGVADAMRDLNIPVGANGGDSGMCLEFLESVLAMKPEQRPIRAYVMLINCGLHDVKTDETGRPLQVSIEDYPVNLRRIIAAAGELSTHQVWVRTTPVSEKNHNVKPGIWRYARDVDAYNTAADAVMAELGVPSIDLHRVSAAQGPLDEILPDGRHFTPEVQQVQGGYIAGWLASRFA